jgi:hypothetical protein
VLALGRVLSADMRSRNMSADQRWNALTESVKQDLTELPNLRGQELSSRMRTHSERVRRLIAAPE